MSFSEKEEEKLIKIVARNTVLYDKSHTSYRNILVKDYVWKTIGNMLNKNSIECKKKWKFIRDGYKRYKKTHKLGTGSTAPRFSKDKRHRLLSFLDSLPQHCGCSHLPASPVVPGNHEEQDGNENPKEEEEAKDGATSCAEQNSDNEESGERVEGEKEDENKKTKEVEEKIMLKIRKQRGESRHLIKSLVKKKYDDVELFVRHIGEVLRNLPPVEKAQAKKHLHAVLSDYEIMAAKQSSERQDSSYLLNSNSSSGVRTPLSSDCYLSSSDDSLGPMDTDLSYNLPGSSSVPCVPPQDHTYPLPQSIHFSAFYPTSSVSQANQDHDTDIEDSL